MKLFKNIFSLLSINTWILVIACLIFISITFPAIFDNNHILQNLEPYPDGILYTGTASNFANGEGLVLKNDYVSQKLWVFPFYPIFLSLGYLLSSKVVVFYLLNIISQVFGIFFFYQILKKITTKHFPIILGLGTYLSHVIIFWLPTVPMSENLSLPLFNLTLLLLINLLNIKQNPSDINRNSWLNKFGIYTFICSLFLFSITRMATIGISLCFAFLFLLILRKNKLNIFRKLINIVIFLSILFFLFQSYTSNLFLNITNIFSSSQFFSLSNFSSNLIQYLKMLVFSMGNFLWINTNISNIFILISSTLSFSILIKSNKYLFSFIFISLIICVFALPLIFYTVDARYIIYLIPLFSVLASISIALTHKNLYYFSILLVLLGIFTNILVNSNLIKKIVSNNIFHRSTSWQKESILFFNQELDSNSILISALPAFFTDIYKSNEYRIVPMSHHQEFLQKGEHVWGEDIDYQSLPDQYEQWLNDGKVVYISNAYITHNLNVVNDYEELKKIFIFNLVSSGCDQACNIYKLSLE